MNGCLNLENKINDSLSPVPEFRLEIQENTIVLTVYEGRYKPYLYKGKAYKRNDSSTVEVDRLEYNRLILEGCNQTFEEITSFNQQLTFAKLETEFTRVMGIEKINKDILKTLELYSDQSGFNNAAALLADDNQFTGIDIIRFGDTIDEIMDRESLENISILSQLEKTLQMFRKYYQYEKIEGAERKCIDKTPAKAFREAIANALIHRMYFRWSDPSRQKYHDYHQKHVYIGFRLQQFHQMKRILPPYTSRLTVRGLVQLERITFRAVLVLFRTALLACSESDTFLINYSILMKDLPDGRGGKIITIRWIMTSQKISKIKIAMSAIKHLAQLKKRKNTLIAVVSLFKENWLYEKFRIILFGN